MPKNTLIFPYFSRMLFPTEKLLRLRFKLESILDCSHYFPMNFNAWLANISVMYRTLWCCLRFGDKNGCVQTTDLTQILFSCNVCD